MKWTKTRRLNSSMELYRPSIVLYFVLVVLFAHLSVIDAICEELSEPTVPPTWDDLVRVLELAIASTTEPIAFSMVCPFEIKGDACKSANASSIHNSTYQVTSNLHVLCGSFLIGSGDACIIDCPDTHFKVQENFSLTLQGMTIRGSSSTAVVVEENGRFESFSSIFENNWNPQGNGSAVHAMDGSLTFLDNSIFRDNRAVNGGAVYTTGKLTVTNSEFLHNTAERGGAIGYFGSGAGGESSVNLSDFEGNRATSAGPAVFTNDGIAFQDNTACNNRETTTGVYCDGMYNDTDSSCQTFASQCTFTESPTESPSDQPSLRPSQQPSESPSLSPSVSFQPTVSTSPSLQPSESPSAAPTVSMRPSLRPSESPSAFPTVSTRPSLRPSESPSAFPTISMNPSSQPSDVPSAVPTESQAPSSQPSDVPSVVPTESQAPSSQPSDVPSAVPTESQAPSHQPSAAPSAVPTESQAPSSQPSDVPSAVPTESQAPSSQPSNVPSAVPTKSQAPSHQPSDVPSAVPTKSQAPSNRPSDMPSLRPSRSSAPSVAPSNLPSDVPSLVPTDSATTV